jgi:type VI secretion system protein VasI
MTRPCLLSVPLALGALLSGCSDTASPDTKAWSACTVVRDPADRLACFDRAAGMPDAVVAAAAAPRSAAAQRVPADSSAEALPPIMDLIGQTEAGRDSGDHRARARDFGAEGTEGHHRYLISAPALDASTRAWLAIGCIEAISRLQLVMAEPIADAQARIGLSLDGRGVSAEQRWQVLSQGRVIDAGRGLVAIETLRRIGNAERLRVTSDVAALDGLTFDATGLQARIGEQRKACRW